MDRRARCRDSRFPVRALRRRRCGHCRSGLTTSLRDAILPSLYTHPHLLYGEFVARTLPVQWADIGVVLGARRHGETSAVVELMTREHGRHQLNNGTPLAMAAPGLAPNPRSEEHTSELPSPDHLVCPLLL